MDFILRRCLNNLRDRVSGNDRFIITKIGPGDKNDKEIIETREGLMAISSFHQHFQL